MSLLEIGGLSLSFGSVAAIRDVSLQVAEGELCAVIGPNGAGKTTFFHLISGLYTPAAGTIRFAGQDITRLPAHARVGLGLARTFQITEIFPELSVRESVRIPVEFELGLVRRVFVPRSLRREADARVDALLESTGLTRHAHRLAGELAHGDQRITEIAMALALRPRLLLLDEPTAGLGERETAEVAALITRLHRERGMAMLLVEHDMQVVFSLAQRILVLAAGQVLALGRPDQIRANEAVQDAYLGGAA